MRAIVTVVVSLLMPALLAGCSESGSKGGANVRLDQLSEARITWRNAKSTCPTYSYADVFRSFSGSYRKVSIEVDGDAVTRARLETGNVNEPAPPMQRDLTPDELAQRSNTVEQLQAECATILAHDPAIYSFALQISSLGVPATCLFQPIQCIDDCNEGILLESFACEPLADP